MSTTGYACALWLTVGDHGLNETQDKAILSSILADMTLPYPLPFNVIALNILRRNGYSSITSIQRFTSNEIDPVQKADQEGGSPKPMRSASLPSGFSTCGTGPRCRVAGTSRRWRSRGCWRPMREFFRPLRKS